MMTTVDVGIAVAGLALLATVLGLGLWASASSADSFRRSGTGRAGSRAAGRAGS
jgi:hypothetical protein